MNNTTYEISDLATVLYNTTRDFDAPIYESFMIGLEFILFLGIVLLLCLLICGH